MIADNRGNVLSPLTIAPVNEVDSVLLPDGLKDLKRVTREVGLDLTGAVLNLDAGFDSQANRKCVFNPEVTKDGMRPNIKENPRNRKKPNPEVSKGGANASLMKCSTNSASLSNASLPGKTSSNDCYCALRQNKFVIVTIQVSLAGQLIMHDTLAYA